MNNLPSRNIVYATRFPTYAAADTMATKIAADDSEWEYGVNRVSADCFVISVHEVDGPEVYFLGYL